MLSFQLMPLYIHFPLLLVLSRSSRDNVNKPFCAVGNAIMISLNNCSIVDSCSYGVCCLSLLLPKV